MVKSSILSVVTITIALSIAACNSRHSSPPADKTPPQVTSTIPANGSENVSVNLSAGITIFFSKTMDASTINDQMLTLVDGQNIVPGSVMYTESSGIPAAVFTPISTLNPTTLYIVTVNANVKDSSGNIMGAPYTCSFNTGTVPDTIPPHIAATTPRNEDIDVMLNAALSVTFDEPVDQATISFLLSSGDATFPCTMSYSGTTAIFTPLTILASTTSYTATVSAGVKDLAGNAMPNSYIWSFVTGAAPDTTPPFITAAVPTADATGVSIKIAPSVTFSEPVDEQTISFSLSSGITSTSCKISYSGSTAIFTPPADLDYSTQYTATVSAGVQDLAGNAMPNSYIWSFVTTTAPDTTPPVITATVPRDGAGGVDPHKALSVTFSEPVDSATITFSLSAGETTIDCDISYSGTIAIFTPRNPLLLNTRYSARVSAGVQDLAGNAMLNDYLWSFTTKK